MSSVGSGASPTRLRIGVDAMGSDRGCEPVVLGVRLALKNVAAEVERFILAGDEAVLRPLLRRNGLDGSPKIEILHTSEAVSMDEKPLSALKHKKEASMFKVIDGVRDGTLDAMFSCGNTGALVAGSTLKLRMMEGLVRPALASVIPTRTHRFILIDVGANPTNEARFLVHNAVLGSHFAQSVLQETRPRVGLLTIGTEDGKGNEAVRTAHEILKQCDGLNYKGLIEGFDLFRNKADVVVCDGFVGNIVLKTCESLFLEIKTFLKEKMSENSVRKLGALLCSGAFRDMKRQLAPEKYSGAPLLGLNGWVFKSHGSGRAEAVAGGIGMMVKCVRSCNLQAVKADVERVNALLEKAA